MTGRAGGYDPPTTRHPDLPGKSEDETYTALAVAAGLVPVDDQVFASGIEWDDDPGDPVGHPDGSDQCRWCGGYPSEHHRDCPEVS